MEALWAFAPLFFLLAAWRITKICKQNFKNDLQEKVAWLSKADLFFAAANIQNDLDAPTFCKLTLDEEDRARVILQFFCQKHQFDFVQEKLVYNRTTYKMTNVCYFMHSLCSFLSDWNWNNKLLSHDLCKNRQGEIYELTDWGQTFCKLLFVSLRYCEINASTKLQDSNHIKRNLEMGTITFKAW